MNKKAQITIFIIIAIVILVGVLIYFLVEDIPRDGKATFSLEQIKVKSHVDSCLEKSVITTLFINGLNAGYYINDKDIFENYSYESPSFYYFLYGEENIPSIKAIEEQISLGIEKEMLNCLNNSQFDFEVHYDFDSLEVKSFLFRDFLRVDLFLPIFIQSNNSKYFLKNFGFEKKTNYLEFYNLAKNLTSEQLNHPEKICLSCMSDFSLDNGLDVEFYESTNRDYYEIIYYIYDPQEKGDMFSFAHKFKLEGL